MVMMRTTLALVAVLLTAAPATGQVMRWDPMGANVTRAELQAMLERYEGAANVGSGAAREEARAEAALLRQRLEEGDMRVGDRVLLDVMGYPQLSDTFPVTAGRLLVLPEVGDVPLAGVLRSELEEHLRTHLARFYRSPVVRARALVRLEILGAVGRPGYYAVPSDVLVSDALMHAGGPSGNADLQRVRLQRGRQVLWEGERMRQAMQEGRTLDQLSVQAGDGIHVPERGSRFNWLREGLMIASGVATLIWALERSGVF
jgi:hypothetical protein